MSIIEKFNIHLSEPWNIVRKVEQNYKRYCDEFGVTDPVVIVNNSGGKDSGVTDLLANHILGGNYRSVAADTGNESPITIEHLHNLHISRRGGPVVELVNMQYDQALFDTRAATVEKDWAKKQRVMAGAYRGILMPNLTDPETKFAEAWRRASKRLNWGDYPAPIDAFRDAFKRSGNSFLDMALLHGGFPLGRQRFCTEELKMQLVLDKVLTPLIDAGHDVVQWSGVRADESEKRSTYPQFEVDKRCESGQLFNFLPIHDLNVVDVFSLYSYFGVNPNPLYRQGMERVGCMPCILVTKGELKEIASRFPDEIDRIEQWERQVAKVSRWMHWMIVGHIDRRQFKYTQTVNGKRVTKTRKFGTSIMTPKDATLSVEAYKATSMVGPRGNVVGGSIRDSVAWANGIIPDGDYDRANTGDNAQCSTKYGLC